MRRRRTDNGNETVPRRREDELEELLEHGSRNFRRYRRRAYAGFAILAASSTVALLWVADTADRAGVLAQEIQRQRVESIRSACVEQNARHDATIRALDTLIARLPENRQQRAREGRSNTALLIESLQPRRDCAEVVRRAAPPPATP